MATTPTTPTTPTVTYSPPAGLTIQAGGNIKTFLDLILKDSGQWTRGQAPLGPGGNQNICGIFKNLNYPGDEKTAWCAAFVNFVLKNTGYMYTQDVAVICFYQNPEKWGGTVIYDRKTKGDGWKQAQPGDICIWDFVKPGDANHINFVYENKGDYLRFCGGNQDEKSPGNNNPSGSSVTAGDLLNWNPSKDRPKIQSVAMIFRPAKRPK